MRNTAHNYVRINVMIALGATVVALRAPYAGAAVFTSSYEGDVLPEVSDPAWTEFFGQGSESVLAGIFTLSTAAGEDRIHRLDGGPGLAWDPTGSGGLVETRLQVISQDGGAGIVGAGSLSIQTGERAFTMRFSTTDVVDSGTGEFFLIDTTDAFHTYLFRIDGSDGPVTLFVDGSTTAAKTFTGVVSTGNRLDFGDNASVEAGEMDWDYIRWTNTLVPEPSTLALLGMAGLLPWNRRRGVEEERRSNR